jgi:uncharacterized protein (TIGR02466 family)
MSTPSSGASSAIDRTLSIDHVDLFPTLIWQARLSGLAPLFPRWIEAARAGTTLSQPVYNELHGALRACCQYAFAQMGQQGRNFTLGSSVEIQDKGGFTFPKVQTESLLSGLFFLQAPPGSGAQIFRDPRPGVLHSPLTAGKDFRVTPEAGLVLLFPPWLEHYAEPHGSDMARIALSFNAS